MSVSQLQRQKEGWAAILMACWIGVSGCWSSPTAQLSGRWLGARVESSDGSVSAARSGWAKGTSLSFSRSRLTVALPGEPPRHGKYQVLSEDDGQLELQIEGHDGHLDRTRLTIETDDLLRWHLSSVHTLVMRRE
jgi:hypothetical protein